MASVFTDRALRELMSAQRKRIWRAAQPKNQGGDGQGWEHGERRAPAPQPAVIVEEAAVTHIFFSWF